MFFLAEMVTGICFESTDTSKVSKRNVCIGDVMIIIDGGLPRNCWKLGRVTELLPSSDGHIRRMRKENVHKTYLPLRDQFTS